MNEALQAFRLCRERQSLIPDCRWASALLPGKSVMPAEAGIQCLKPLDPGQKTCRDDGSRVIAWIQVADTSRLQGTAKLYPGLQPSPMSFPRKRESRVIYK